MRYGTGLQARATAAIGWTSLIASLLLSVTASSSPRQPGAPLPEMGLVYSERFDQPYDLAGDQIDSSVWIESWSGFALNRSSQHPTATPWIIPVLDPSGFANIPARGAIRFWYKPEFTTGTGPANLARLLTLVTTNGSSSLVWWSLVAPAGGSELDLVCQQENGPAACLAAPVAFEAGVWRLVTLCYTETNSALFVDDQQVATGSGLIAVPFEAAPLTGLIVGGGLTGGQVACGQIDELAVLSGVTRFQPLFANEFGIDPAWSILNYYAYSAPIAALGALTNSTEATTTTLTTTLSAVSLESVPEGSPPPAYDFGSLVGLCLWPPQMGTTNVTLWLTNTDGTILTSYDVYATTNLSPDVPGLNLTNWAWVGRTSAGQNAMTLPKLSDLQCFYRLGTTTDSDGDGLPDAYEILVSHTATNMINSLSSDGHGTPDAWYLLHGLDPLTSASQDANGDGVLNWQEYVQGSDPRAAATFSVWLGSPNGLSAIP